MVVIRLSRGGTKKRPFYHIVVAEKTRSRDGRFIELLGTYNPVAAGKETILTIKLDRIAEWVGKGAQPSDRVKYLVKMHDKLAGKTKADVSAAEAA